MLLDYFSIYFFSCIACVCASIMSILFARADTHTHTRKRLRRFLLIHFASFFLYLSNYWRVTIICCEISEWQVLVQLARTSFNRYINVHAHVHYTIQQVLSELLKIDLYNRYLKDMIFVTLPLCVCIYIYIFTNKHPLAVFYIIVDVGIHRKPLERKANKNLHNIKVLYLKWIFSLCLQTQGLQFYGGSKKIDF